MALPELEGVRCVRLQGENFPRTLEFFDDFGCEELLYKIEFDDFKHRRGYVEGRAAEFYMFQPSGTLLARQGQWVQTREPDGTRRSFQIEEEHEGIDPFDDIEEALAALPTSKQTGGVKPNLVIQAPANNGRPNLYVSPVSEAEENSPPAAAAAAAAPALNRREQEIQALFQTPGTMLAASRSFEGQEMSLDELEAALKNIGERAGEKAGKQGGKRPTRRQRRRKSRAKKTKSRRR